MSDVADFWAEREVVGVFDGFDEERDRETVREARRVFGVDKVDKVVGVGKVAGVCVCCGDDFVGRVGQKYCCQSCYRHVKFGRVLLDKVVCGCCGVSFRPSKLGVVFCGVRCEWRASLEKK